MMNPKKKLLFVFGTRPEVIKLAPLIKKAKRRKEFSCVTYSTAQHREILDSALEVFRINPDYDSNLMKKRQSLVDITAGVLFNIESVLEEEDPDIVVVQGDTTTAMSAALSAFYKKIPVAHVEAGLRSYNIYSPYPEEMNRRLISTIASLHFAPTERNVFNLIGEGVSEKNIFVTGNTVIDALHMVVKKNYIFHNILSELDWERKIILLTTHRREYWGLPMKETFLVIKKIIEDHPDVSLVFPVHPNPIVKNLAEQIFEKTDRVYLIDPLDYISFVNLMYKSYMVFTDSGGIQEEAPSLGKPVIVLRNETERPEAVEAGTVKIVGSNPNYLYELSHCLITNKKEYEKMAGATNPYGDGRSSDRILNILFNNCLTKGVS